MSSSGQYALGCINNTSTGKIYCSNDYGINWTEYTPPSNLVPTDPRNWTSVAISSSGQYAIGCIGNTTSNVTRNIYYSNDYGSTWTVSNSIPGNWVSLSISSSGQYALGCIYNATFTGGSHYSNNYGVSWTKSTAKFGDASYQAVSISGSGQYAVACTYGTSSGYQYASSNTSTTYVSKDLTEVFEPLYKYKTWTLLNYTPQTSLVGGRSIVASYTGQYLIASNQNGASYYSSNYGATWTSTTSISFASIAISNNGQYALGSGLGSLSVRYTRNYGALWTTIAGASGYTGYPSVVISSSGQYMAYYDGSLGTFNYSTNAGTSFTAFSKTNIIADSFNFESMAISSSGQYAVLAVTTANFSLRTIYVSSNFILPASFTKATIPSGTSTLASICSISMSSSGQYAVASAFGQAYGVTHKILYSTDYGVTWQNSNSPASQYWYYISISDSGQYAVAVMTNTTGLYYSNNYGVDWTSITTSELEGRGISISGNGQYAFASYSVNLGSSSNKIYRCTATN
jgi:hypothetical protein